MIFQHPSVAQVAVVGIQDELKGQLPFALFVLKKENIDDKNLAEKVKSELIQMVRKEVGAVAAFKMAIAVKDIPRTRSGKTPRKVLADLASGREYMVSKFTTYAGAKLQGGQGGNLPTQFFRDQRQKIPQNCKIRATCK